MSVGTTRSEHSDSDPLDHVKGNDVAHHPTDAQYVKIALILGVITALEIGTYFLEDPSTALLVAVLFPMMVAKFAIVGGYFMHLKYDTPLFKRIFVFGLVLAIVVYVAVLATFEFFDDSFLAR